MSKINGKIHSFESFGAVDGPGIRFVAFLQGCPLRCIFCHNSDTWDIADGKEYSANELVEMILSYKNFIKSGGVTLSGGEPLMQPDFVETLLDLLRKEGIHTAIDTSGAIPLSLTKTAIKKADLILLDIKSLDDDECIKITGMSNKNALETLDFCESVSKPVWIRHVCIPNYTLDFEKIQKLADYLKNYSCIEKVELIPFHQMGSYKWDCVDEDYTLADMDSPNDADMENARQILIKEGIKT